MRCCRTSRVSPNGDGGESMLRQRGHETAIAMEYEMWVMPTCEFLRLSEVRPHEALRAEQKIVRADDSMQEIFYLSHEWTSLQHPDHSTSQLHAFQRILLRMISGSLPETSPTFADAIRLPKNVKISSSQWKRLVTDSFVFMDFLSVRQVCDLLDFVTVVERVNYLSRLTQMPQKKDDVTCEQASRSIAAYIERSSFFFILCPTVQHHDHKGVTCDYGSWLQSSENRFELFSLLLSRNSRSPPIVRAQDATPKKDTFRSTQAQIRC